MILRTERGTDGLWSVAQQIDTPRLPGGGTDGLFAWAVANADNLFAVSTVGFSLGGLGSARIFRRNLEGQGLLDPLAGPLGREDSGAAYVFTLVEGLWTQTNFYKAFNADAGSAFAGPPGSVAYGTPDFLIFCETQATTKGASMSLSGDTLAIGTPFEDSAATGVNGVPTSNSIPNSGAVYIFDNSEGQ